MRRWLNTYFDLSKREFNGLLVLVVLIVLVSIVPELYGRFRPRPENMLSEREGLQKFASAQFYVSDNEHEDHSNTHQRKAAAASELFLFDPNAIDIDEWEKLGLSARQAQAVIKYRNKGGRFYKKEDLQKMYTITDAVYRRLEPYISITGIVDSSFTKNKPESLLPNQTGIKQPLPQQRTRPIIEINQADTAMLEEIWGIGPSFARRITKYKERLGGFYKKEQLMEVYGLDSNKYAEIKDQVLVDGSLIRKIAINTATFEDFRNHPYLRYKQVNAILQYRKQHGNYTQTADLNKIAILDRETIAKLAPYLSF